MKAKIFTAAILLVLSTYGCKKENNKQVITDNPLITGTDNGLDELVRPYAKRNEIVGLSIGLSQNGNTNFYNYGEKEKGGAVLPKSSTAFEIGSISKTFTALMLIDLFNSKQISLDTKVNDLLPKYIPALQHNGKYMLVKHLLNHTSGLPRLPADFGNGSNPLQPYAHYDSLKIYNYLKTFNLKTEPGTAFDYSNLGMGIAGLLLERVTGKSYADYLKTNVAEALKFNNTTADFNLAKDVAMPYDKNGNRVDYWSNMNGFKGAGAIYSCVDDLVKYGQAILSPEQTSLRAAFNAVKQPSYDDGKFKVGLGWFFLTINGRECIVCDGGTGGFRSFMYICPATRTVLVVLSNNGNDDIATLANTLSDRFIR